MSTPDDDVLMKRIQLDLPPRALNRLTSLKKKTEAVSYAEVIKNALRVYEAVVDANEAGAQLLIRDQQGAVSPLRVLL